MNIKKIILLISLAALSNQLILSRGGGMGGGGMSGGMGGRSIGSSSFSGTHSMSGSGFSGSRGMGIGSMGSRSFSGPLGGGRSFSGPGTFVSSWNPSTRSVGATLPAGWLPTDVGIDSWSPGMTRQIPVQPQSSLIDELEGRAQAQKSSTGISAKQLQKIIKQTVQKTVKEVNKQQAQKVYAEQMAPETPAKQTEDPATLRKKLNQAMTDAMANPQVRARFLKGLKTSKNFSSSFAKLAIDDPAWLTNQLRESIKQQEQMQDPNALLESLLEGSK